MSSAGASEEERLSQMIRDYYELDSSATHFTSSSKSLESSAATLQESLGTVSVAEDELLGKIFQYSMDLDLEPGKLRKWLVMKLGSDRFEASMCKTSWLTRTPFTHPSDDYEYIEVMMKNDDGGGGGVRLIVDVDFRSQFELARPTAEYEELSNCLPKVFVGTESKLEKVISLVCPAAKKSLRERGLHIPPWRKASYFHSKWLSKNCKKISFSELGASPIGN